MNTSIALNNSSIIHLTEFELEQTVGGNSSAGVSVTAGTVVVVAVVTAPAWVIAAIGVAAVAGATYAAVQIWG